MDHPASLGKHEQSIAAGDELARYRVALEGGQRNDRGTGKRQVRHARRSDQVSIAVRSARLGRVPRQPRMNPAADAERTERNASEDLKRFLTQGRQQTKASLEFAVKSA